MRRTGKGLALSEVETYPERNDFRIIHAVSNVSPTDVGHHVLGYIPSGRSTSSESIGRKTYRQTTSRHRMTRTTKKTENIWRARTFNRIARTWPANTPGHTIRIKFGQLVDVALLVVDARCALALRRNASGGRWHVDMPPPRPSPLCGKGMTTSVQYGIVQHGIYCA